MILKFRGIRKKPIHLYIQEYILELLEYRQVSRNGRKNSQMEKPISNDPSAMPAGFNIILKTTGISESIWKI